MKYVFFIDERRIAIGLLLFSIIFLLYNCKKSLWNNPHDELTTIAADEWNVTSLSVETTSPTSRKLTWEFSKEAVISGFRIDRKESIQGEWVIDYARLDANKREWLDTLLVPEIGEVCSYRIITLAGKRESSGVLLADSLQIPSPVNLTIISPTENSCLLSWTDRSVGEEVFVIDRKQGEGIWIDGFDTLEADSQSYLDDNLFNDKQSIAVSYRVRACFQSFSSLPATVQIHASLSPPDNLKLTPLNTDRVKIEWHDGSNGEAGYRIERKLINGDWESVATTDAGVISWVDPNSLWTVSQVVYRVAAFNGICQSGWLEGTIRPISLTMELEETLALQVDLSCEASLSGNYMVQSRGVCWNTLPFPILDDNFLLAGTDTGHYSCSIPNLPLETTFYIRAFATHQFGTVYSNEIEITTPPVCGSPLTIHHKSSGGIAPVDKTVVYNTSYINGLPGRCFITSNLGASREANSFTDQSEESAGWYWQFNTLIGYKHDGFIRTPENAWPTINAVNTDWLPELDPCRKELGSDWRLPTSEELTTMVLANNWHNSSDMFESVLKFHCPGVLGYDTGHLLERGNLGGIYTSTTTDEYWGYHMRYSPSDSCQVKGVYKTNGLSIRCVRDETSWKK